jgi:hypothetical protein
MMLPIKIVGAVFIALGIAFREGERFGEVAGGLRAYANREAIKAAVGADRGCTLRLIGDWTKLSAAYSHAESLLFRDAGCLSATIGLCAAYLG